MFFPGRNFKITLFFLGLGILPLFAQNILLRDDFRSARSHWKWEAVGNALAPRVSDGMLEFRLIDPLEGAECNTAIWDGENIYRYVTVKVRVKALTPMQPGSRGWGLWQTGGFPLDSLQVAWFMQQRDPSDNPFYTWWTAVCTNGSSTGGWVSEELSVRHNIQDWHVYKIVWTPDSVVMYLDSLRLGSATSGIPRVDMAFHAWVDNQIYPPSQLPVPYGWTGENALLLDYVDIRRQDEASTPGIVPGDETLLVRDTLVVFADEFGPYFRHYSFRSSSSRYYFLLTGRLEDHGSWDVPEKLDLTVNQAQAEWAPARTLRGDSLKGGLATLVVDTTLLPGTHEVYLHARGAPSFYDFTLLNGERVELNRMLRVREFAPARRNFRWKSVSFSSRAGTSYLYLAAAAREDTLYSWDNPVLDEERDDDLRLIVDSTDFGWNTLTSIDGNRLRGDARVLLLPLNLPEGNHTLEIWTDNRPYLADLFIFTPADTPTVFLLAEHRQMSPELTLYPNPFNNSLQIQFTWKEPSALSVRVFDITGRVVRTLVRKNRFAGVVHLEWDGRDDSQRAVSSGVYLITVEGKNRRFTKKVLYLR